MSAENTPAPLSKRALEKDKLARKLAAGEISQRLYDERMARLGGRGTGAKERYQAERAERRPAQRDGRVEWTPQAPEKPSENHRITITIDDLTFRRLMRAMVVSGTEDIGQALGKLLETLPPEK